MSIHALRVHHWHCLSIWSILAAHVWHMRASSSYWRPDVWCALWGFSAIPHGVHVPVLADFSLADTELGLRKAFSKFYRRHSALLEKYSVSLKTLLQQCISEPEFYGDLVYRFRKIVGKSNFSEQFRKLINRYKRIGYSLDIMRQTAFLVVNPSLLMAMLHSLIARRRFGPQTQWWPLRKTLTSGFGLDDMSLTWPAVVQLLVFIYAGIQ